MLAAVRCIPQIRRDGIARLHQAKMPKRARGGRAPARRALQVALLKQIRFEHVFDGVAFFVDGDGEVVYARCSIGTTSRFRVSMQRAKSARCFNSFIKAAAILRSALCLGALPVVMRRQSSPWRDRRSYKPLDKNYLKSNTYVIRAYHAW